MSTNYATPKTAKIAQLENAVARFMANREPITLAEAPSPSNEVERVKIVGSDLLLSLMACRLITKTQFRAGREWQSLMVKIELQGYKSVDWSLPISMQHRYQMHGEFSERQEEAFDRRATATAAIGVEARNALDRMLAEGSYENRWYSTDGLDRLCDLLTTLALHFDFRATGIDDGYSNDLTPAETVRQQREAFMRRLKREQPWLFSRIRTGGHRGARY